MKKKHLIFWIGGAIIALILVIVLLLNMSKGSPYYGDDIVKSGEVTIGVTGNGSTLKNDTMFWQGIELAVDEINQNGGLKSKRLKIDYKDDQGKLVTGNAVANSFVLNRNLLGVIGHVDSDITVEASRVYNVGGKLLISPLSTSDTITSLGYPYSFMNTLSNSQMAEQNVKSIVGAGKKKVAIFYEDSEYGRSLTNYFELYAKQYGIEVIDRVSDYRSEAEFMQIFNKWSALECDSVFVAHVMPRSEYFLRRIQTATKDLAIYCSEGAESADIISRMGALAENISVFTIFNPEIDRSQTREFIDKFKAKYGKTPDTFAVHAYDSVKLIAAASEKSDVLRADYIAKVLKTQDFAFEGVAGRYSFDGKGNTINMNFYMKTVKNGQYVY